MTTCQAMQTEQLHQKSIQPVIAELERAFSFFGTELWFKPRKVILPMPVITVQYSGRGNNLGWFWEDKWEESKSSRRISEINICAEHLRDDVYEIADTLLHEMVHYANWLRGIRDCSSNQYHNRKFRRECESIGLICKKDGWRGFARTELTPELRELVDELEFSERVFSIFRVEGHTASDGEDASDIAESLTRKEKLAKWSCYCRPPVNVRVAAGLEFDAICNRCGTMFQRQFPRSTDEMWHD